MISRCWKYFSHYFLFCCIENFIKPFFYTRNEFNFFFFSTVQLLILFVAFISFFLYN